MYCLRLLVRVTAAVRRTGHAAIAALRAALDRIGRTLRRLDARRRSLGGAVPAPVARIVTALVHAVERGRSAVSRVAATTSYVATVVAYLARWVCWPVDWLTYRWWAYLLSRVADDGSRRVVPVHVTVVTVAGREPPLARDGVRERLAAADDLFAQCDVGLAVEGVEFVDDADLTTTAPCGVDGLFSATWAAFFARSRAARTGQSVLSVYVVESIPGRASGCAYPLADWVTVEGDAPAWVLSQEIAHACHVWRHDDDPDHVMSNEPGGSHDQFTARQRSLMRTSRFAHRPGRRP